MKFQLQRTRIRIITHIRKTYQIRYKSIYLTYIHTLKIKSLSARSCWAQIPPRRGHPSFGLQATRIRRSARVARRISKRCPRQSRCSRKRSKKRSITLPQPLVMRHFESTESTTVVSIQTYSCTRPSSKKSGEIKGLAGQTSKNPYSDYIMVVHSLFSSVFCFVGGKCSGMFECGKWYLGDFVNLVVQLTFGR